jgi:hypothetical protein
MRRPSRKNLNFSDETTSKAQGREPSSMPRNACSLNVALVLSAWTTWPWQPASPPGGRSTASSQAKGIFREMLLRYRVQGVVWPVAVVTERGEKVTRDRMGAAAALA